MLFICFEQVDGRIAIKKPKCCYLVFRFHVRNTDFENSMSAVCSRGRSNPRAAHILAVEWRPGSDRPSGCQLIDHTWETAEPFDAIGGFGA